MSDKKQPTIVWQCHRCNHVNADNRKSYVICVGCGQAYDKAPKDGGDLHQEWANRAAMIVRGTQDSSSGWYNSPVDLLAVVSAELSAAFIMGQKSVIGTLESE
jgi:hypothetical protein